MPKNGCRGAPSYACGACSKSFGSQAALNQHNAAKARDSASGDALAAVRLLSLTTTRGGTSQVQGQQRTRPFTSPAYAQQYSQGMARAMPDATNFSEYPTKLAKEMEHRQRINGLGQKLQAELESKVGWKGSLDKTIQAAQDQGVLLPGGRLQQSLDQFRRERNTAQHSAYGAKTMQGYKSDRGGFLE